MIPSVIINNDHVMIPIFQTSGFCYLKWEDDVDVETFLKSITLNNFGMCWDNAHVWTKICDAEEKPEGEFYLYVYDVKCYKTDREFHLISYGEITDFEDIKNCVCLPFNRLNLLKFYKEYLIPFSGSDFFTG